MRAVEVFTPLANAREIVIKLGKPGIGENLKILARSGKGRGERNVERKSGRSRKKDESSL